MSNYGVKIPRWNPNTAQMDLFQEWRKITIQHLVSCKKGILPFKLPGMLQEVVDERLPLDKMGLEYRSVNHFLYQLRNDIILRSVDGKIFVFIKESSVPQQMQHIRQMVLGQKGKDDKPLRHHGVGVEAEELLRFQPRQPVSVPSLFSPAFQNRVVMPVQFPGARYSWPSDGSPDGPLAPPRSGISPIQSIVAKTMAAKGLSDAAPRRIPRVDILDDSDNWRVPASAPRPTTSRAPTTARRYLPGIDDEDSSSDSGDFDFYSGPRKLPPPPLFAANKTLATQEEKKVVTTREEKKTLTATSTSATVVLQPQPANVPAPSTAPVLMGSNPPLTAIVPKKRVWGKNQLMARMKAIMEREGLKEVEATALEPNIAKRDVSVTVQSTTGSVCNAPKISEQPEPSFTSVNRRTKVTLSTEEQRPDFIESRPCKDVEQSSGHPYHRITAAVPPRTHTFKQVVKFPTYLMGDAPKTLKGFLEKTGQLKKYMKS